MPIIDSRKVTHIFQKANTDIGSAREEFSTVVLEVEKERKDSIRDARRLLEKRVAVKMLNDIQHGK